eukprot:6988925-Pyramimonas_sp.AAC.1
MCSSLGSPLSGAAKNLDCLARVTAFSANEPPLAPMNRAALRLAPAGSGGAGGGPEGPSLSV